MRNITKYSLIALLALVLAFVATAIPALILMLVLNAIGIEWGFWVCFGIVLLINLLIGVFKR